MKICQARPQLVFTFNNRFSSSGWAVPQSVRYISFRLQASYLSATSHTGRKSCRVKSLYMKRFWFVLCLFVCVCVCVCVCVQLSTPWISVMNGPWAASLLQDQAKFSGLVYAKKISRIVENSFKMSNF
jgi:hypothetical protein